jgi:hypothetical protein
MSGRDIGQTQISELSVSVSRHPVGGGGEEDALPAPTPLGPRRVPGATNPPDGPLWSPVAVSLGGERMPVTGALDLLLDGLHG